MPSRSVHVSDGKYPLLGQYYQPLTVHLENPYPLYAQARREAPIFWSEVLSAWIVTRYADVRQILAHPEIFSSKDTLRSWVPLDQEVFSILKEGYPIVPNVINTDGEQHQRFRVPLNAAFSSVRIKAQEERIRQIAHRLLESVRDQGAMDLVAEYATPLPLEVILELCAIPQTLMQACKQWSADRHALFSSPMPKEQQIICARSIVAFQHTLAALIDERKEALLKNKTADDLISTMLTVVHDARAPLSQEELIAAVLGTILAGHMTTTHLIGNACMLVLSRPTLWPALCEHPVLIGQVLEEVLRYDGGVHAFYRTALHETALGGIPLPQGARLLIVYGAANRDETAFPDAEQFAPGRPGQRHLAFGYGLHHCVGAALARMEGRIALEVLSQHFPSLQLVPDQIPTHLPEVMFRGWNRLSVSWEKGTKPLSDLG